MDSEASEMLKNDPLLGSLVRKVHLRLEEVRQAEREERLFSLMGPAPHYSFYANEGNAEVSTR